MRPLRKRKCAILKGRCFFVGEDFFEKIFTANVLIFLTKRDIM